jgi:hypothetical protein
MKSFLQAINEDHGFTKVLTVQDTDIWASGHFLDRLRQRDATRSIDDWKFIFTKMVEWIKNHMSQVGQWNNGEGMFFSRSKQQSVVVSYRRSRDNPSIKRKDIYVMTVFEPGKDAKPNSSATQRVVLESALIDIFESMGYDSTNTIFID